MRYDGPDLAEVARLTGLTVDEVIAAHSGDRWRVAFGGFAPGFAYLVGGDPRLVVAPGTAANVRPGRSGWPVSTAATYPPRHREAGS